MQFRGGIGGKISIDEVAAHLWRLGELQFKLHAEQLAYEKFNQTHNQTINVFHCSRGFGKTWYFLCKLLSFAIKNPKSIQFYYTKTNKSAKNIVLPTFRLLTTDAPKELIKFREHDGKFIINNEAEILLMGCEDDPSKLRGTFADNVVIDEAGFLKLGMLDYVVEDVCLDMVRRRNGKIWITTTTPLTKAHDFYKFKYKAIETDSYFTRDSKSNPFMTKEQLEAEAVKYGGWNSPKFRREHLNEDITDPEHAVIPDFKADLHIVNEIKMPVFFDCYTFIDFGLVDYTHVLFAYYDFDLAKLIIVDEYVVNYATTKDVAEQIKSKELSLWGDKKKPTLRVADNEMQQIQDLSVVYGITCAPASKYDSEAAINRLRRLFQDNKILVHSRCKRLISQLENGIWNDHRTDYQRSKGLGHLDGIDALKYGIRLMDWNKNPYPHLHGLNDFDYFIPPELKRPSGAYEKAWGAKK